MQRLKQDIAPYFGFLAVLSLSLLGAWGLVSLRGLDRFNVLGLSGLIGMGAVGVWRWSWLIMQVLRAQVYLHWAFPRWRRRANRMPLEQLPPVCLLVPTYREKPWITERVFRAIAQEAKTLAQPMTLLVTSSSDEENAAILSVLQAEDPKLRSIRLIQMVQTGEGKRKAMAEGLRKLASLNLPADTIVALMDGDSELTPGTLQYCLPFFRLFPRIGALTTDELPIVDGSYLFSEWFHLRMAQRHYQMCSVSLSHKVMCLTGRFSLFRGTAALHPDFADQLEVDTLDDWLWGTFKFLSGDDKSTWYWLLKHGYDMLYVPDVIVYSLETISGSLLNRAYQNMRRWYGNMLRSNSRALALGVSKTGWFMGYCLLDQRISMWTTLITPGLLLVSLLRAEWLVAGAIFFWILLSRPLILALIFAGRRSHLKLIHLPLWLLSQWSSSLVKIWTLMNLSQQKWSNRGNQSISAEGTGWLRWFKLGTSRFLYSSGLFSFGVVLFWMAGTVNPVQDIPNVLWFHHATATPPAPVQIINVMERGIIPDDGKDDAALLQAMIDQLPEEGIFQLNLPIGELDLFQPLTIHRSHTILQGKGAARSHLLAHFDATVGAAMIVVEPPPTLLAKQPEQAIAPVSATPLQDVRLRGFTLHATASPNLPTPLTVNGTVDGIVNGTIDGIVIRSVIQPVLQNLTLIAPGEPLLLQDIQDEVVQYVAVHTP